MMPRDQHAEEELELEALALYLDVFQPKVRQHLTGQTLKRLSTCLMEIDQADVSGDLITNYKYLGSTKNDHGWLYPGLYVTHWIPGENASFDIVYHEYNVYDSMYRHAMIQEGTAKLYRVYISASGWVMDSDGCPFDLENLPHDTVTMIEHLRQYAFEHQDDKYVDMETACKEVYKRAMDHLILQTTLAHNIPF